MAEQTVAEPVVAPPRYHVAPGWPHPLGATPDERGTNFCVFSQHGSAVELLIFDRHDDPYPSQVIDLDPNVNRTFYFWHVYVLGLKPGTSYAFRVEGPRDLHDGGHRYNRNKVLLDPYSKGVTDTLWNRVAACGPEDNVTTSMRSVVVDTTTYDWEGDRPLRRPMSDTIIYEMHVGGFTKSPTSRATNPGTFSAVIEKIPYLKELGITALELMPVFEFDQAEVGGVSPVTGEPLSNYWGYSTVNFFTPNEEYCVTPEAGTHVDEFRDMVKALHKAGIEVILDVVFNHSAEGNHMGPVINFKGFDNSVYYHLEPYDKQYYSNYSGCGNTLNCNHPVMEKFILECLRFWVKEMHVDGFRFDLAAILARGTDGKPMENPPVIWAIELDNELADTKIIAEAWDIQLYQVGTFPGERWAEWNGRYRDDIRRFVKGDEGMVPAIASRVAGSADIYQPNGELPINSINFITAHDGFTLNDLVSYNEKHNEANGEGNRDGTNDNLSWNCGVEGPTDDAAVEELRNRQVKNFLSVLLLSQGVPMLLMGDETRQTQFGNNNAYCQDNEITWYDWERAKEHQDVYRFTREMIRLRKRFRELRRKQHFTGALTPRGLPDITWHGCKLGGPGWRDPSCQVLSFTIASQGSQTDLEHPDIHVILNMEPADLDFELPVFAGRQWHRVVDTGLPSPDDICEQGNEVSVTGESYRAMGHSVVVLISKLMEHEG